jgi:hypothetical protein
VNIHPSAIVSPDAQIGRDAEIGPLAVIEADVVLGEGCRIICHESAWAPGAQPRAGSIMTMNTAQADPEHGRSSALRRAKAKDFPVLAGRIEPPARRQV